MAYATVQDVLARYDAELVGQLTGSPRGDTVNEDSLNIHLEDASDEIDDYLATRVQLPLDPDSIPPSLVSITCDLAIYRLQGLRPLGDIKESDKRHQAALKRLEAFAARTKALAGTPATSQSVKGERQRTVFTRPVLRRFGGLLQASEDFRGGRDFE